MYLIYRDHQGKIIRYSETNYEGEDLEERITAFNVNSREKAEIVKSEDLISLIEIAEEKKKIRLSDVQSIQDSVDNLQNEIYNLSKMLKEPVN